MRTVEPEHTHQRWWRQPLIHFLLIGLAAFVLYEWTGSRSVGDKKIVVDREALLTYVQYRAKYFDAERSGSLLDDFSESEFDELVDEYVREEVLYREALALGLDRNDYMIRRRLIQKLEFINKDLTTEVTDLTNEEVTRYFEAHRDDYINPARVTFAHVFFDGSNGKQKHALERARKKMTELNTHGVAFDMGAREGDSFYYHADYVEHTPVEVANHFGRAMTEAVFELDARDDRWHGPLESPYGYHLVMVTEQVPSRRLDWVEVSELVKADARRARIEEREDEIIQDVVGAYDVEIMFEPAKRGTLGVTVKGSGEVEGGTR